MTKRPARKAVSLLLLALLTAASLGADDPKSAPSTSGPTDAEIAERVRDLGRGGREAIRPLLNGSNRSARQLFRVCSKC